MSAQREGKFIQQNFIAACIYSALCNVAQIGHNVRIGRIQPVFAVVVTPSAAILILHRQVGILFGCRLVLEAIYASDNVHAVFAQLAHVLCEFFRLLCLQVLHVRYHIGLYRNVELALVVLDVDNDCVELSCFRKLDELLRRVRV